MTKNKFIEMATKKIAEKNKLTEADASVTKDVTETLPVKKTPAPETTIPTEKDIVKMVDGALISDISTDKDGVSKDGGECDKLMSPTGIEDTKKRQDNNMKDVINVADRKVEEAMEINNELLMQLQEAEKRETLLKDKIASMNVLAEKAMVNYTKKLTHEHANEMKKIFESIITEGEKIEKELVKNANTNKKLYETAQKQYKGSTKLAKILLKALKEANASKTMTRYVSKDKALLESFSKK